MGVKDAQRLGPLKAAVEGRITNAKGAELTGLSLRQFKRLKQRVRQRGAAGLLHGNRGRPSSRRLDPEVREQVVKLLQHPEARLNDCHVRDVLEERGVEVSAETVRGIRRALGLAPKRRRRPPRHHCRRLRAARIGSLVLIDGTEFAWLGSHQPPFTLVGTLDDATSEPLSLVRRANEDLHGFTQAVREMVTTFGVPEALYGDRTAIAVRNDGHWSREEELAGRQHPTHFGCMLEELGIRYIAAHSPEAKGRIERHWQMVQDRLPAELALRDIRTLKAFDAYLPQFLASCRKWFALEPRESVPAWRSAPRHLDRILLEQPAPAEPFSLVPRDSARPQRRSRRDNGLRISLRIDDPVVPRPPSPAPAGDRAAVARDRSRPTATHPWKRRPFKPQRQPAPGAGG